MSSTADLINNPDVGLDNNIIADVLAKFLKWEPWSGGFALPEFRLEALYGRACGFCLGPRVVTADALESLGSLYAVALFHAMHPAMDRMDRRRVSLLQSVMCECLVVMDALEGLSLMHPGNQLTYWNNILTDRYCMVGVFDEVIGVVKGIIRDLGRQVRNGRERGMGTDTVKGKKRIYLSDCMAPHSIYLICLFGLSHAAIVAVAHGEVQLYPGLVESSLLALLAARIAKRQDNEFNSREEADYAGDNDAVVSHMVAKTKEPSRFPQCLDLAGQLGFLVVKSLDLAALRQVNLVKGRMVRRLSHPKAAFARAKTADFRNLLSSPLPAVHPHLSVRRMDVKELKDLKVHSQTVFAATAFRAGRAISADHILGLKQSNPPPPPKAAGSKPVVDEQNLQVVAPAPVAAAPTEPPQEKAEYWGLHERVRPFYVVTLPLRHPVWETSVASDYIFRRKKERLSEAEKALGKLTESQTSFSNELDRIELFYSDLDDELQHRQWQAEEHKAKTRLKREQERALRKRQTGEGREDESGAATATQTAMRTLEPVEEPTEKKDRLVLEDLLHRNEYKRIQLPRLLDPTEGMYWLCQSTAEYIEQEVSAGRIFRADDGAAMDPSLSSSVLHNELQLLKKQRLSSEANRSGNRNAKSPRIPSRSTSSRGAGSPLQSTTPRAAPGSRSSRKPTTDLEFKLQVAKKEAALEIRLSNSNSVFPSDIRPGSTGAPASMMSPIANTAVAPIDTMTSPSPSKTGPSSPILQASLRNPVFYSTATGQTKAGQMSEAEFNKLKYFGEVVELSVVWRQQRMKEIDDEIEADRLASQKAKLARAKRLDPKAYIAEINDYKDGVKKQKEDYAMKLEDAAESITGMLRTFKAVQIKEIKETRKRESADSIAIRDRMAKAAKDEKYAAKLERQREEELRILEEEKEIFRIRAIKNRQRAIDEKEEAERRERAQKERVRLKDMADKAEHNEILRRMREEARMKFLEERQREKERRLARAAIKKQEELYRKQNQLKQVKQKATKVVRKGNFMWHNGKFGFYKDARPTDIPYLQYEDDYGTPYYFDPLSNTTSYDTPGDAPIIHHTDKEREEFDGEHGEGEYDKLMEQRRFKDQCNLDGGYYSQAGVWLELNGYYDENYAFVSY